MNEEELRPNIVDFEVKLTHSKLFDLNTTLLAMNLCKKFPGLNFDKTENTVRIYGRLNDYWFNEFNKAVFEIGEL